METKRAKSYYLPADLIREIEIQARRQGQKTCKMVEGIFTDYLERCANESRASTVLS